MNERDYMIIEYILLSVAIIGFIIGIYILQIFNADTFFNKLYLITISTILLLSSFYFRYKKNRYIEEMIDEIKKCLDEKQL